MIKYNIHLVSDADEDLFEIYKYVAMYDSIDKAENLLAGLEEKCNSLRDFPERGHLPPELDRIGIKIYKEIHFKPYRIIFQIIKKDVYIHCILDGRRDLMDLLQKRLLR
jgi:toxin ParE1/3/4